MTAALPETIGKFRVQGLLGRGAMGVVYKAIDPDIERPVAIKLVRADLLDGDDRAHYVARFRNEARMVGRCIHPNIVGIHDLSSHEGNPFLVLEFVDGMDLGRSFRRGTQIDLATTGRIALGVLKALGYAHGFGIIHRDVKPANILLTQADSIKVTDFGISRAMTSDATMSSILVGTPSYMSPEQCLGGCIDARSDIFSMGSVLHEMLSGEKCFAAANLVATTHKILHETPASLQALRPDLPAAVVRVIETALAKRPEDRFQTAGEMAQALREALRSESPGDAADEDPTFIGMGSRLPGPGAMAERITLQAGSLAALERRLAQYVGPLAGLHLRRILQTALTPDQLVEMLAEIIPQPEPRAQMRDDLQRIIATDGALVAQQSGSGPQAPSGPGVPPATIDAVTKALTVIMGPIAGHLLRRALRSARTPAELEQACLEMIDNAAERERFTALLAKRAQART